jgi:hypothetical protein
MYGQEGPTGFSNLLREQAAGRTLASGRPVNELPKRIMESEQLMATTGGGNRLGTQPVLGSMNPVRDMFEWDKLRGLMKNLGYFQGRN